jgi:hypothetical protein
MNTVKKKIESLNIKFLRFTNPEIYNDLYNVLEKINEKVKEIKIVEGKES